MKRSVFLIMLPAILALVLLAAFILVSPVYAQDEVPPEEVPPTEELAPVLEEAAETGITLADESGEPLPLSEEGTAEVLAGGDPWYKVGAVTYNFTFADCDPLLADPQPCSNPIQAAIDTIPATGLPSDGMIYVEADSYTEYVTVPGYGDPLYHNLKGLIGAVVDGVPQVNLTGDIWVNNVDLGFTITGFNITANANIPFAGIYIMDSAGAVKIEDVVVRNTGSGPGIKIVNHTGTVTLTRVKSSGNTMNSGALIDNTTGTSGVTISNSAFETNFQTGLNINSKGKVTINGISASGNNGDGANISALGGLDIRNSVFSDNSAEIGTDANGLRAYENVKGNITLINVLANRNENNGLFLGSLTGSITASGLTAAGNGGNGAWLDTCFMDAGVCTSTGTASVTLSSSDFLDNSFLGLAIQSRGRISANLVNASGNGQEGAQMITAYSPLAAPAVTITRSLFEENGAEGVEVWSKGSITLNNVTVDRNGSGGETSGAWLSTSGFPGSIYVYDTYGPNTFSHTDGSLGVYEDGGHGLYAFTWHNIVVNGASAVGNDYDGLRLENSYGTGTVTLARCLADNNGNLGLEITSKGAIKINDSNFSRNRIGNAVLDNRTMSTTSPAVSILRGEFNESTLGLGLFVLSDGAITLTDSRADKNVTYGARLENSTGNASVSILYKKLTSHFDANGSDGIEILSNGNVVMNNAIVMGNGGMGAIIDNCRYLDKSCRGNGSVSITSSSFYTNHGYGLLAISNGAIMLSDVSARFNVDGTGAYLVNNFPGATGGISVNGSNKLKPQEFSDNESSGLVIRSNGPVNVKNADLVENDGWGLSIQNQAGAVNLTSLYVADNGLVDIRDGISIETLGSVTISDTVSAVNGRNGALLLGYMGSGNVVIKNSQFNVNHASGLVIRSAGLVSLTNVDAWSNEFFSVDYPGYGVDIDNTWGTAGVTLYAPAAAYPEDYNLYFDNAAEGLHILTRGAVSLAKIDAHENTGDGVSIENLDLALMKPVSVVNSLLNNNTHHGITITTAGAITFTGNTATGNTVYGASLDNCAFVGDACQSTAIMTIKSSHFDGNTNNGLSAFSGGNVLLDKVTANGSVNGSGAGINVSDSSIAATTVTVQRSQFNDNRYDGLVVTGLGTITVNAVEASRNMALESMNPRGGMILDNYTFGTGKIQVLSSLGANTFNDNARYGLAVFTNGTITVSKVTSLRNGSIGLYLMGYTNASNVTINSCNLRMNQYSGLYVSTYGTIALSQVVSLYNSIETNGDGATLYSHGKAITISQSAFHGNGRYGIYANAGDGIPVTISKSSWFGNGSYTLPDLAWVGTLILIP